MKSFIVKNKFLTVIISLFLVWIVFLVILTITNLRVVVFYDALGQSDVSNNYWSEIPWLRYLVEPFAASAFILEMEFTWMFLFIIGYIIVRVIYVVLRKKGYFSSKKYEYILNPIRDLITFIFIVFSIALLAVLAIILIGALVQGFFFINRYFMVIIQLGVTLAFILIVVKAFYLVLIGLHPKLKFDYGKKAERKKNKKQKKTRKSLKTLKKEIVYLFGIGFLLLGSNIILISIPFPGHQVIPTTPLDADEFLFDFHIHTIMSDGWLTPQERVNWYINHGIDGAAFTDHDNLRGSRIAREYVESSNLDFLVFIGQEWTDHENDIHMNYYNLEEEIVPLESEVLGGPRAMNTSDLIAYVKANGGFITVNHYNYKENPNGGRGIPYNLTQLRDWGVDGFEIVNGGSYGGKYQQIRQFCLDNNLTCFAGSDIHTNEPLNTFIKVKMEEPTNLTMANIFYNLRKNEHEVVAISFYPEVVNFPGDLNDFGFYIIEDFINYLFNMNIYQSISWIIWSTLFIGVFVLIYLRIKKSDLMKVRLKFYKSW